MYKPSQVSKCEKCRKVIAEPKELIEFWKKHWILLSSVYISLVVDEIVITNRDV